jgi:hyaluronan synthase
MISFILRRFRPNDSGGGWVRLFSATKFIRMTMGEAFKFAVMAQLILAPVYTLVALSAGCIISASLPALVYQKRHGGWFGWRWAIPYSFYWLLCLYWISLWGLLTAPRSAWLTRGKLNAAPSSKLPTGIPTASASNMLSKAA